MLATVPVPLYTGKNIHSHIEWHVTHKEIVLRGVDQNFLPIYIFIYTTASSDEIVPFIHSNGGGVYTRSKISEQRTDLQYTKKG